MAEESILPLLCFTVDGRRYSLTLDTVERVLPSMEASPLPKVPPIIIGLLNLGGELIPVIDVRRRLGLPPRDIEPEDRIILAHTPSRRLGLVVDCVEGVVPVNAEHIREGRGLVPGVEYVRGIVALEDGVLLISDLDAFLSLAEAALLDRALAEAES